MTEKKLRQAMELIIANHVQDFFGGGCEPEDLGVTEEEMEVMSEHANYIAMKISKGHPLNLGNAKDCVDYFRNYKKKIGLSKQ